MYSCCICTCDVVQDKVIAIAKLLRGKLAKAPAHKQPLHTQVCQQQQQQQGVPFISTGLQVLWAKQQVANTALTFAVYCIFCYSQQVTRAELHKTCTADPDMTYSGNFDVCCLQYLPSALRNSGKRQLDCLGIATAVLALCQQISQQHSQHADLASSTMMVSDDHCWLRLAGAADGNWVQVEVTDPR